MSAAKAVITVGGNISVPLMFDLLFLKQQIQIPLRSVLQTNKNMYEMIDL